MKCGKENCLANLNGECAADECKGELVIFSAKPKEEVTVRKKLYEMTAAFFEEDFKQEDSDSE